MKLTISINKDELRSKIKKHLSIIAKRAKDKDGNSIFSEVTTSTTEDSIYDDMMMFAAEDLVSRLKDMCSAYLEEEDGEFIKFDLYSERWNIQATEIEKEDGTDGPTMDLTKALESSITNYLYNYSIARYLNSVSPVIGRFADPYMEHCQTILQSTIELAFTRRAIRVPEYPYTKHITTYGDFVELTVNQQETITYSIDYGKKDDIVVEMSPNFNGVWCKTPDGVVILPKGVGKACMILKSHHDSDVFKHIELNVKEKEEEEKDDTAQS